MIKELTRRVLLLGMCTLLLVGCAIPPSQGSTPPALTTPLTLPPATTSPTSLPSSTDWTTYHRNNARTGLVENAPDPHQLTRAWNVQLDGAAYAEPLVVGGRVIVETTMERWLLHGQMGVGHCYPIRYQRPAREASGQPRDPL